MSQDPSKTKTLTVLREAGIGHARLGAALGRDGPYVSIALSERISAEEAGEMCRVLGEMAGLSAAERREVFRELVNRPGEGEDSLFGRVSSEHPMEEVYDAVRERYGPDYEGYPGESQKNL